MEGLYLRTRKEWREWLNRNHNISQGVWLVFYKKAVGKPTLDREAAVQEALCFGWIDSIIKRLDHHRYLLKMSPRKMKSHWSELNKQRIKRLIKQGLMTPWGLRKVKQAKQGGGWEQSDTSSQELFKMPQPLIERLSEDKNARFFFDTLAPTYKKQFLGWINSAKREGTRIKRISQSIELLRQGKKLGMK